jgi:hypothetical protein
MKTEHRTTPAHCCVHGRPKSLEEHEKICEDGARPLRRPVQKRKKKLALREPARLAAAK